MELGLSLGSNTLKQPFDFLKENKLDLAMDLSLNSSSAGLTTIKAQKLFRENDDGGGDGGDRTSWGTSEKGSSGNVAPPAMMGSDVKRLPATAEEVSSSANSLGLAVYPYERISCGAANVNSKRGFEATTNDVVEGFRASDDDDSDILNRKKLRLSKEQSAFLEERFKDHSTLNPKQKLALAKQLNLRPRQVEVWFQNRRARTKLKQTEVDCEYLKRCCEKLTEENRKLQRELQELRALRKSKPFNVHMPATTLTMCPSCERTATRSATGGKTGAVDHSHLSNSRFFPFSHLNQPKASKLS